MLYNGLKDSSPKRLTYSEKLFLHRPAGGRNQTMEIITITADNIDSEHICCAVSDKKDSTGANAKKSWMKDRFQAVSYTHLDVYKRQIFHIVSQCKGKYNQENNTAQHKGYGLSLIHI